MYHLSLARGAQKDWQSKIGPSRTPIFLSPASLERTWRATGRKEKNMATVSRQSAFWAIVGLGLNTFAQDGGKVLGFPAEWARALRLSPIVCIIDTLSVLFSIAFFSYQSRSLKDGITLAARYRCLTEDDPAEPKLERTWWFRFSIFGLGALPQAVKLLALGGTPLTKIWGMAYLVSFLVLEGLDLLQSRQRGDDHTLETNVEALDICMILPGGIAVVTQVVCLMVEFYLIPSTSRFKCDVESGSSPPPPEPGKATNALITFTRLVNSFILVMLTVLFMAYLFVNMPTGQRFGWNLAPLLEKIIRGLLWWVAFYVYCSTLFNGPSNGTTLFIRSLLNSDGGLNAA